MGTIPIFSNSYTNWTVCKYWHKWNSTSSSRGNQQKKRQKKKLKKESHWDMVSKQYKEGKITKFEYVKQMSYKLF